MEVDNGIWCDLDPKIEVYWDHVRSVSWGFGGLGPMGHLRGAKIIRKRERREREREKKKRKEREKQRRGTKKRIKERLINMTRGAPFRGEFKADASGTPPNFSQRKSAWLHAGASGKKEFNKSCKLTLKIEIFLHLPPPPWCTHFF